MTKNKLVCTITNLLPDIVRNSLIDSSSNLSDKYVHICTYTRDVNGKVPISDRIVESAKVDIKRIMRRVSYQS